MSSAAATPAAVASAVHASSLPGDPEEEGAAADPPVVAMEGGSNPSLKLSLKRSADEMGDAPEMTVTLLRHSGTKRVLYMEAGKDFVDLLFSFLLLPVGTILSRLAEQSVASDGAIANVAGSVSKLSKSWLYVDKSELLIPQMSTGSSEHLSRAALLQLKLSSEDAGAQRFYSCTTAEYQGCDAWRVANSKVNCPTCGGPMSKGAWMKEVSHQAVTRVITETAAPVQARKSARNSGFVKRNLTFTVTDDLEVWPSSSTKSIDLLNSSKVGSISELESCEERVGVHEALKLLAASFSSKNVLNDVFGPRVISSQTE